MRNAGLEEYLTNFGLQVSENGSGGVMSDVVFNGGAIGFCEPTSSSVRV